MSSLRLGVGLVGPGNIGGTFLKQLRSQKGILLNRYKIDVNLLGIMGTRKMHLNPLGIDLADWRRCYHDQSVDAHFGTFFDQIKRWMNEYGGLIVIDGTASDAIPDAYNTLLESGCHIVTPNKRYGSGPLQRYKRGRQLCLDHGNQFMYEATVGAGLPVISTLQGMLDTGDNIHKIEGVFSGTLSYIFNRVSPEVSFSSAVMSAKELGYTEPDPRDDLAGNASIDVCRCLRGDAGMDVARKVVVLARECGLDIELDDLEIQSLVPDPLAAVADPDTFLEELRKATTISVGCYGLIIFLQYDAEMLSAISEANDKNEVLRYVGVIDMKERKCEVGLKRYPCRHAFGGLNGTDNMVIFASERYNDQPLVIRGPGAGAEVTAMGVFSDFLTIAKRVKN